MATHVTPKKLSEQQCISFYGALFSMAGIDGTVQKDEMLSIFENLDLDGLSESGRHTVHGYLASPPNMDTCLWNLKNAPDEIRFGLMINLLEVAQADDYLDEKEALLLDNAQKALGISNEQRYSMLHFVKESRRIRERGLDDNIAADTLKRAVAGLTGVGIPITAVYLSGSVIGLSAAGITSGLAALGLGFGMVPGIGTAILIGTVTTIAIIKLLDVGGKRKKEKLAAERERKAQLVIKNLQESINSIVEQINKLRLSAAESEANRKAIEVLTKRLRALQQAVNARKRVMENA